jgi:Flp pilus assembly protein TadB
MTALLISRLAGALIPVRLWSAWAAAMVIGKLIKRRVAKFTARFPDAIELMVRGLRSGLPISETIGIVADELPDRSARVPLGRRQDEDRPDDGRGAAETATRLGTPEFQFYVISLAISARPAAIWPRPCRTSPTCCASARR